MPDDPNPKPEKPADDEKPVGKGESVAAEPAKAAEATAAVGAKDDEEEEEAPSEEDAFRPEAIAKRIEKLGAEDEMDRIAREEEQKLAARRKELKKKGKKGLESAASKKLAKIGERAVKRPASASIATPEGDQLLARSATFGKWAKKNQKTVSILVAAGAIAAAAFGGYMFIQKKKETAASLLFTQGVADERGIVDAKKDDDADKNPDPRPTFKTADERRAAALAMYQEVQKKYPSTGAALLGRLGEGTILLDKQDAEGAAAAFKDVKDSPLGQADPEVKGRALEDLGFAYELAAQQRPEEKDKYLDLAMGAFKELAAVDGKGWKELGEYNQARIYEAKGDSVSRDEAEKMLRDLYQRLQAAPPKLNEPKPFAYLENAVADRLRLLNRSAVGSRAKREEAEMNRRRMEQQAKMMEQFQKKAPPPSPPPAPEKK